MLAAQDAGQKLSERPGAGRFHHKELHAGVNFCRKEHHGAVVFQFAYPSLTRHQQIQPADQPRQIVQPAREQPRWPVLLVQDNRCLIVASVPHRLIDHLMDVEPLTVFYLDMDARQSDHVLAFNPAVLLTASELDTEQPG